MAVADSCFAAGEASETRQLMNGRILWPENYVIPRFETEVEREYRVLYDDTPGPRAATPPPTGPLHCVAEYEPMEGILINWRSFTALQAVLVKEVTTTATSNAYIVVSGAAAQASATTALLNAGANLNRVQFLIAPSDSVWMRDYGPRYCYEGQCRVIVDHTYNRLTRPSDNALSQVFATFKKHTYYEFQNLYGNNQLIHGGGNYQLSAAGGGFATRLILNENMTLDEFQITDIFTQYWRTSTTLFEPFPTAVDATQHIDKWMQIADDDKVVISDFSAQPGSLQDQICENAAITMTELGYTVYRVPAFLVGGVHYTYTNVVIVNNLILIPSYTNAAVSPSNAVANAIWQSVQPSKMVVQLDCQSMIASGGALHSITVNIPVARGGVIPTAYLRNYRGGETVAAGQSITVNWISDDDVGGQNADILMSTDSGATWPTTIVAATADDGSHTFSVPSGPCTRHARFRVVVRDVDGNTGHDSSTSDITVTGQPCLGDTNCDGQVNLADVQPMVQALIDPVGYARAYPGCTNGDLNLSSQTEGDDIQGFVAAVLAP